MLDELLDIFRLRQYFNVITRTREWVAGLGRFPDRRRTGPHCTCRPAPTRPTARPFAAMVPFNAAIGEGQRIVLAAWHAMRQGAHVRGERP